MKSASQSRHSRDDSPAFLSAMHLSHCTDSVRDRIIVDTTSPEYEATTYPMYSTYASLNRRQTIAMRAVRVVAPDMLSNAQRSRRNGFGLVLKR